MSNKPWEPEINQTLKNIHIPSKTKCSVCKRVKQLDQFSTKQLNDLRLRVHRHGQAKAIPKEGLIRCRECTGTQNVEMPCIMCLQTKPLDAFSLAQRNRKDTAVCLFCQEKLDETCPDDREQTTGHDDTASISTEDDDDDSRSTRSDPSEIWLFDHASGNYVTDDAASSIAGSRSRPLTVVESTSRSGSISQASDSTRQHGPSDEELTRKNLAKLSLYDPDSESSPYARSRMSSVAASKDVNYRVRDYSGDDDDGHEEVIDDGFKLAYSQAARENSPPSRFFRAYDPSGRLFQQRRVSTTTADESNASSRKLSFTSEAKSPFSRRGGGDSANEQRGFARVRPQNKPIRHYQDDDDAPAPTSILLGGKTMISTAVMEDMDSDDE